MLQYLIAGIVTGCIYAIASTGLVMTYRSSGILNLGFGGIAFAIARLYYYLNTEYGWSNWSAAIVSILVVAPMLGVILYLGLFRYLRTSSILVKMIATIGLGVTFPPLALLIMGTPTVTTTPGLAPLPVASYQFLGVAINLDQVIIVVSLVVILVVGYCILRFTEWGTLVKAVVDSPALMSLTGSNPNIVSVAVSAVTIMMAGLAGVLLAPTVGLDAANFALLTAAAFTAVLVAKLTYIGRSIVVSLLLGVVAAVLQYYLPPTSKVSGGIINSVPFAFIIVFLLWEARKGVVAEGAVASGDLDRAVAVTRRSHSVKGDRPSLATAPRLHFPIGRRSVLNDRAGRAVVALAIVVLVPLFLSDFWVAQVGLGLCFAVVFLSSSVVTGEGGMIWLCQAGFAGLGAVLAAHFSTIDGVPILLAIVLAGLCVVPLGFMVGLLTNRLGDLYVALVTLALGVLIDNLVLSQPVFTTDLDTGVEITRPGFADTPLAYLYLALAVFVVLSLVLEHFRRSSRGLLLAAVRGSDRSAQSMGISVMWSKVGAGVLGAFVAGVGGALVATDLRLATPSSYNSVVGLIWLAVLVTMGVRSSVAAASAGIAFAVFPAVMTTYLPVSWSQVPPALFGLGAILLARNPEGVAAMHRRQGRELLHLLTRGVANRSGGPPPGRRAVATGPGHETDGTNDAVPVTGVDRDLKLIAGSPGRSGGSADV